VYIYRTLTSEQKKHVLRQREAKGVPLHSPPLLKDVSAWFLITAATFEHVHYFDREPERTRLKNLLLKALRDASIPCSAFVILPNHYHLLLQCDPLKKLSPVLRRVHAASAVVINRRDNTPGRQVWYKFSDRQIRNQRHYYTTLNYIHYNPAKHGYIHNPLDWKCSSMKFYERRFGIEFLRDLWRMHPLRNFGAKWDDGPMHNFECVVSE
jgi:putative transposase